MPAHGLTKHNVRWNPDLDGENKFEMRCEDCLRRGRQCFWPLDKVHWDIYVTLRRCKACNAAKKRAAEKARRIEADPDHRKRVNREWARANRDHINRTRRERRARAARSSASTTGPA